MQFTAHIYRVIVVLVVFSTWICEANDPVASIKVVMDKPGRKVPAEIFGTAIQWSHNGDQILSRESDTPAWWPGALDAIHKGGFTNIRFPGGSLASTYRWQSGIGDWRQRPPGLDFVQQLQPSNFGTDELILLTRKLGMPVVITANSNESPEEAAQWLKYLTDAPQTKWGALRARNVGPQPLTATWWEIGNEVYSPIEPGHTSANRYAQKFLKFSRALKKADSRVRVGAVLEGAFLSAQWIGSVHPHMVTWNDEVLSLAAREMDFAIVHFYGPFDELYRENDLRKLVYAAPLAFARNLDLLATKFSRYGRPDLPVAVTEYNTLFGEVTEIVPRTFSTEGGLFLGLMLFEFMRNERVVLANHWSLMDNVMFGMIQRHGNGVLLRPTYNVFKAIARFRNGHLLQVEVAGDGYSVHARGNVPALAHVNYVDAAAVRHADGQMLVAIINRSPDASVTTRLSLTGAGGQSVIEGFTLSPADRETRTMWHRKSLSPVSVSGTLELVLPAESFTLLEVTAHER